MAQAVVNIKMDAELKREMTQVCKEMGISLTTAFNIFAARVVRDRAIPFDVSGDPFYSETNLAHIREGIRQIETGQYVVKTMEELEAAEYE